MNTQFLSIVLSLFVLCSLAIKDISYDLESFKRVHVEFERHINVPNGWYLENRAVMKGTPITLTWALKQRNLNVLEKMFWDVSDPHSPNYGKYMNLKDISDLISPVQEDIKVVEEWIDGFLPSYKHLTFSKDFLVTTFPVEVAEEILQVKFSYFSHPKTGIRFLRTLEPYTLPSFIAEKVDFVGGVHRFPIPRTLRSKVEAASDVTPDTIRERYNVSYVASSNKNSMATSQFLRQWYSPSDLSKFFDLFGLPDYQVAKVVGKNDESTPGIEASLDIQYIMGVGQNVTTWFYFTSGYDNVGQEPFIEWITALNDDPDTPWVNSVSYGDEEYSISGDYLDRCNVEFQKFGVSGRSVLFASGDSGVGCIDGESFSPEWPTQSPYVTSVGGTYMNRETEVGVGFSGGGFSNYFGMPSYQKDAVSKFFSSSSNLPPSSFYNSTSRAYPDIAAFATNYQVVVRGFVTGVGGTSASTPTVSGIISLLNDIRLNNNLPTLGFLNPWLYDTLSSTPEAFYDVTSGTNSDGTCQGFTAISGWDPITGVGTPNFEILKSVVLKV